MLNLAIYLHLTGTTLQKKHVHSLKLVNSEELLGAKEHYKIYKIISRG